MLVCAGRAGCARFLDKWLINHYTVQLNSYLIYIMVPRSQDRTKTVPASQVKNSFGAIVNEVQSGKVDAVIVENRGAPTVAIVSVSELPAMQERKEQERQRHALSLLREARSSVQARLKEKLTDAEALKLTEQFGREVVEEIAKAGTMKFERDGS
jgi:prevent-host-death family protein